MVEQQRCSTHIGAKSEHCYVCGPANAKGLRVSFAPDASSGSRAEYTAKQEHEGWTGILHGGVAFSLMDEAIGWSLFFQKIRALTARIETRFVKPIPIGSRLMIRAWVVRDRRRIYEAHSEIRTNDAAAILLAEANATMVAVN